MESSTNLSNHDSADEHEDVERAGVAIHQDVRVTVSLDVLHLLHVYLIHAATATLVEVNVIVQLQLGQVHAHPDGRVLLPQQLGIGQLCVVHSSLFLVTENFPSCVHSQIFFRFFSSVFIRVVFQ